MGAVSQLVPNFLGGVSTRPDTQKAAGEVREATNVYLDPTFGLTKRSGFKFIKKLGNASSFTDAHWFSFKVDTDEFYIGAIVNQAIYLWNSDGTVCTITYSTGVAYLNATIEKNNFVTTYRDDKLYILNKTKTVLESSTNTTGTLTGTVQSFANLPSSPATNSIYHVINSAVAEDDAYFKYDGTVYNETVKPGISDGLTDSTMPHTLTRTAKNTFTFARVTYTDRTAGDNTTNPQPSFVGQKITDIFFHNNRFGVISKDNVIMSQPNQFENFYGRSALTTTESDPIDLNCSSVTSVVLNNAIPITQGLLLFSEEEQFIMFSDTGLLTPSTATIKSISNFFVEKNVRPVRMGTSTIFLSKTPSYSRVFFMETQGANANPNVTDVGKKVAEWIPDTMTNIVSDSRNFYAAFYGPTTEYIYFFRRYVENGQIALSSWFNWECLGNVHFMAADNDKIFTVNLLDASTDYMCLMSNNLNEVATETQVGSQDQVINPRVDLYAETTNNALNGSHTKVYVPFDLLSGSIANTKPLVLIPSDTGNTSTGTFYNVTSVGTDATGQFFQVDNIDLTSQAKLLVGYKYDLLVDLPTFYYRTGANVDVTAHLNIARLKVIMGLTGRADFNISHTQGEQFNNTQVVATSNFYIADTPTTVNTTVFTVPVHQRNTLFKTRIQSDSPLPITMQALSWEGNYTPKYYVRG